MFSSHLDFLRVLLMKFELPQTTIHLLPCNLMAYRNSNFKREIRQLWGCDRFLWFSDTEVKVR